MMPVILMMRPSLTFATAFAAPSITDALVTNRPSRETNTPGPLRSSLPDASNTEISATAGATRGTDFWNATEGESVGCACGAGVVAGEAFGAVAGLAAAT